MQKNNNIKFEVLHLPPVNTNSLLVSAGNDCVIFDAWGNANDWKKLLNERGLNLRAIYITHGHPDHISAAPTLARDLGVDWFLNSKDNFLVGWGNEVLGMFGLPSVPADCKQPRELLDGITEILPGIKMDVFASPGHTPGGVMFYFPEYKILLTGDTLFAEGVGRYDFPGGDSAQLYQSIRNLYDKNMDDETYVVHGHGHDTTIEWLKKHNKHFKF